MDRFSDRFEAEKYEPQNPDAIWLDGDIDDVLPVPEFVFQRLTAIGRAYGLHYLGSVLTYDGENRLNPLQCQGLLEEINFVADLVRDPLLAEALPPVKDRLSDYIRTSKGTDLIIDLES